ncbi:MAG: glucose-6-phosphate dehydrogenase assembly protein OpcA [Actinomycetota bacterium]
MRTAQERSRWRGKDVGLDRVVAELALLNRSFQVHGHGHAMARTLNLIVAPVSSAGDSTVDGALAGLGAHSPSRTLVLRRHGADRLDAELVIESEVPDVAGRVGVSHDRVTLTADDSRLEHAASLLAPLLLSDLPTVLWLPERDSPIPDPRLLDRAQQILVDSTAGDGSDLLRLGELARSARVHDLAWGRLEFWRAATAAAFEPPERRALLPRVARLDVRYEGDSLSTGLLLAGWVTARAGWRPGPLGRDDGRAEAKAVRADGGAVALSLAGEPEARGCGGIENLTFRTDADEVRIGRGAATSRLRDLFAEALQPMPSFARGYQESLGAVAAMLPPAA